MVERRRLPAVYSAHHASDEFGELSERVALTPYQQYRYADLHSGISVPENGVLTLRGERSRGVVDLNRAPNDSTLFPEYDFGRPPNKIWQPGLEPTPQEKARIKAEIYDKYHGRLLSGVRKLNSTGVVVSWDSSSPGHLGKTEAASINKKYVEEARRKVATSEATDFDRAVSELDPDLLSTGANVEMPPIILSNRGDEESAESSSETVSCDPQFLLTMADQLRKALQLYNLPDEVHLNLVYKGGHVGKHYNTFRNPNEMNTEHDVHSFQIEYSTGFTHDPFTFQPKVFQLRRLKAAFELAMYHTYANFLKQD